MTAQFDYSRWAIIELNAYFSLPFAVKHSWCANRRELSFNKLRMIPIWMYIVLIEVQLQLSFQLGIRE